MKAVVHLSLYPAHNLSLQNVIWLGLDPLSSPATPNRECPREKAYMPLSKRKMSILLCRSQSFTPSQLSVLTNLSATPAMLVATSQYSCCASGLLLEENQ